MPETSAPSVLLHRVLRETRPLPGLRCLGAVTDREEPGTERLFFGTGSGEAELRLFLQRRGGLTALQSSGGGWLAVLRPPPGAECGPASGGPGSEAPVRNLPTTAGPETDERDLLAGRKVVLAFRVAESAEMVADWLVWHRAFHNLSGALIVNRAPPGPESEAFAARLEALLAAQSLSPSELVVLLVQPDYPTGRPDSGPESHPFLAPDAPGRDRMTPPEPDPFRSPLAEGILPELLKWRWLGKALAVARLDPCDYLLPRQPGEADLFDRTCAARGGVFLLRGERIYPWRLRPGGEPRFADHICRRFDGGSALTRWCIAPGLSGLTPLWRPRRISGLRPQRAAVAGFYRAMALRMPDAGAADLVPRTALVEDPDLLALSRALPGGRAIRPPVSPLPAAAREPGPGDGLRTVIVTTMKNEAPFILEWLAWHRAIGVTGFLIYTNDCTDGTDRFLDLLQRRGLVEHRPNPWRPGGSLKPQHAALQAAEEEPLLRNSDWAICMDVDEFINIKAGDGRLPTLYAAMEAALPGANMISLTWRLFGNADVAAYEDRLMIRQFTLCAPEQMRKPHQAWGFKTLFRTLDIYRKPGVHRPKGLRPDLWEEVRWLNGSGHRMPKEMYRNGWRSTAETVGYDWVQLNHYALRSAESFLVKRDRGRVNHTDRDQGLHYWFRMNHNITEDLSLAARAPMLRAELNRLLADPEIRAAHRAAVAAHRARIAELRASPDMAAFYAELTGPRLRALGRKTPHFSGSVFTAGPGSVPDAIAMAPALPKRFYFSVPEAAAARTAEGRSRDDENA